MATRDIKSLFRSTEEQPTPVTANLQGNIPEWLDGSFLRVGPGRFDIEDFTVNHWFDGFSILEKIEISGGKATYMKKFLQSDAYKKAQVAKKTVYSEFGTRGHPDMTKNIFSRVISSVIPDLTDNCAINVFTCCGQTFVSSETAYLRRIDPKTLETLDKIDLQKVGATLLSGHFLTDSQGDTYTVATELFTSAQHTVIKVPKNDSKNPFKKAEALCTFAPTSKSPSSFHSFGMSENYIIFIEMPLKLNMMKVLSMTFKGRCLYDCSEWNQNSNNVFNLIDKRTGKLVQTKYVSTKPFFFCHVINCYEENNQLVVDLVDYDSPKLFDQMHLEIVRNNKFDIYDGGAGCRYVLPLLEPNEEPEEGKNLVTLKTLATAERKGNEIQVTGELLGEQRGYEQPCINPAYQCRKHRYFYASGMIDNGPLRNTIVKVDTQTGEMLKFKESEQMYPNGPIFIARPGATEEDDGVLLIPLLNTDPNLQNCLIVLDAISLTELGRINIPCHLPNLMHSMFVHRK